MGEERTFTETYYSVNQPQMMQRWDGALCRDGVQTETR
jgi:hypothetical protein